MNNTSSNLQTVVSANTQPEPSHNHSNQQLDRYNFFRKGELMMATKFLAPTPQESRTLKARLERGAKWWLAKSLDDNNLKVTGADEFTLQLVDLKQKGTPLWPVVRYNEGIGFIVIFTPQFTKWAKVKRLLLGVPNEILPYCVEMPPFASMQYAPLYKLSWRLGGFGIQAAAIKLERLYSNTVEFNWSNGARPERHAYRYTVHGWLDDPVRYYLFCQGADARERFENEIQSFIRKRIETLYRENDYNAGFSYMGVFQDNEFLGSIGYRQNAAYEIYFDETIEC